jgi:hypothetical protein
MTLSILHLTTPASTGGAGTSAANVDSTHIIRGWVMAVYLKYNDSPPAGTTDVVLKTKGTGSDAPPSYTILSVANGATDGWYYPRAQTHTSAGVAVADTYDWPVVFDVLNLAVAQANDGDSVDAWIVMDTD